MARSDTETPHASRGEVRRGGGHWPPLRKGGLEGLPQENSETEVL